MELLQLKYFCDAAKTENYSKTAKKFLVPTSNISQSVKRLERELGCELFEHRSNKITLLQEGKLFYERVSEALELIESAKSEIKAPKEKLIGEVKLMILCNRQMVTSAIEKFNQNNPEINFVIWHDKDAYDDADILISDTCPENYSMKSVLTEEDILLAVSTKHPLADIARVNLGELKNERFISMTKGKSLYNTTLSICRDAGFAPNISIQTDDPFYVRKYVELGLGIAFVPSRSWSGLFSENTVLKKIAGYGRKTYICLPEKRKIKPATKAFLDFLMKM